MRPDKADAISAGHEAAAVKQLAREACVVYRTCAKGHHPDPCGTCEHILAALAQYAQQWRLEARAVEINAMHLRKELAALKLELEAVRESEKVASSILADGHDALVAAGILVEPKG